MSDFSELPLMFPICTDCTSMIVKDYCECCGEGICFSCCNGMGGHTTCNRCEGNPQRQKTAREKYWADYHKNEALRGQKD